MDLEKFKRLFRAIIAFIGLTLLIIVLMWIGVRVRYELLNTGFVESNIKQFISGYFTLAALIGTILTLGYTWQSSKEKNLVEVVTKNRADWVKEMKELFSNYFTKYDEEKIGKHSDNTKEGEEDTLIKIRNKISLRLNPNGVIDNDILLMLDELNDSIKNSESSDLRIKAETKIKLYLKCEWERIKFETKEGIKKYDFEKEFEKIESEHNKLIEEPDELIEEHGKFFKKVKFFLMKYIFSYISLPNTLKQWLRALIGVIGLVFIIIAYKKELDIEKFILIVSSIITIHSLLDMLLDDAEARRKEEIKI